MLTTPRRTKPLAKAFIWLLAAVYTALVVYIVFFARRRRGLVWTPDLVNLVPVLRTVRDHRYWDNIFGNVALFVPMPTLVASATGLRGRRALLAIGVAVSVFIEVTQYVLRIGVPDIDDVILTAPGRCWAWCCSVSWLSP